MKITEFFKILKSQNLTHVEKNSGISRQSLHNALKTKNMKFDNLSNVAKALNLTIEFTPITTEENFMSSLTKWGAPLAHTKNGNLSLEQCVGHSLLMSRQDGIYETLLPYVLFRNVDKMNPLTLASVAFINNQVNVLGYFVEMANYFRPHEKFKYLLNLLTPAKSLEKKFLVTSTKSNFPELFEKNYMALAWNLKVRGHADDHVERWKKWEILQNLN